MLPSDPAACLAPLPGARSLQAQRDFFGSHTYERTDMDGWYHTVRPAALLCPFPHLLLLWLEALIASPSAARVAPAAPH